MADPSDSLLCGSLGAVVFRSVRRVGRTVVLVLLTWTAADVLNPALCGLDEFPFVAASETFDADNSAPKTPPIAANDCFCCSHNVNFAAMVQMAVSLSSDTGSSTVLVQTPRWTSVPLYHPPRLRS